MPPLPPSETPTTRAPAAARLLAAALAPMLAIGHRPMFLAAVLWAMAGVALPAMGHFPNAPAPWHAHAMIFGFAGAGFAGYTLSAAPGWSRRPPVAGWPLAVLAGLWLLAHPVAILPELSALAWVGPAVFVWLAALLAREALAARAPKGAVQSAAAILLALADLAVLTGHLPPGLAVLGLALLVAGIGGRIVAAFVGNRAHALGLTRRPMPAIFLWGGPVALTLAGILAATGSTQAAGVTLALAALAETGRMARWPLTAARSDALVAMLVLAYAWLPLALIGLAMERLTDLPVARADLLHALTAGAVGTLIFAVMARAIAHRHPDRLQAQPLIVAGFALVWGAAALRLPWPGLPVLASSVLAPGAWTLGWALLLLHLLADLRHPPRRPVFSGPKA